MTGGGVTSINAEMRVGSVQEIDQRDWRDARRRRADEHAPRGGADGDTVQALPASRGYGNYLAVYRAFTSSGPDRSRLPPTRRTFFSSRGGRSGEGNVQIDGMNVGSSVGGGGVSGYFYDLNNSAEVQVTIAGGLAEVERGGPAINIIPSSGGNTFSGTLFRQFCGRVGPVEQPRR